MVFFSNAREGIFVKVFPHVMAMEHRPEKLSAQLLLSSAVSNFQGVCEGKRSTVDTRKVVERVEVVSGTVVERDEAVNRFTLVLLYAVFLLCREVCGGVDRWRSPLRP